MISVVIPALNEESTVGRVVEIASLCKGVDEVIVVDDKSSDNTIAEARKAGAKVVTSTKLGKGVSMRDGIHVARNEVIAFLDADIVSYRENVVELLTEPIVKGESDFVKSYFSRQAGRVTELVAKPLLSILYPEFPTFKQPLSGMIAGRKKMFLECSLEDGYGVDIGILIDMYRLGARIKEVNIGIIENRMQALSQLGRMSREVARTIIMKTKESAARNLETYENIQVIREQMEYAIREGLMSLKKIAMFDMDNTILRASFIQTASDRFGFRKQLTDIVTNSDNPFIRTKQIARLLRGRSIGEMLETVDGIDVTPNLSSLLMHLKAQGYIIGIISDSYDCITNHIKNRFGFDFTISNELEFSKSVSTGEVKIPSFFLPDDESLCKHEYCKLNALISVCKRYGVDLKSTLVIGDGENDICCIRRAGIGVSFCSTNSMVDVVSDYIFKNPDFADLVPVLI